MKLYFACLGKIKFLFYLKGGIKLRKSIIKKQEQVTELQTKFKDAQSIISFDYQGLTVDQFTELRQNLRKEDCFCKVYKNNIARRASKANGFDEFAKDLTGPKAIAYSKKDPVAPARIINEFAKKNKKLKIASGVVNGEYANLEKVLKLATLPDMDTLLTMLAVGMLSPVRELTIGLHMLGEKKQDEKQK